MVEVLENIANKLEKDMVDYIGVFTPILLSIVAILISMWNSFGVNKIKRVEANMVWDDLLNSFFIIIRNTGTRTLVIKTVSLIAKGKLGDEILELGMRDNTWAIRQDKEFIRENEMMAIKPIYGSLYDVFAYRGHYFGVDEENKDFKIKIVVTDIDGKKWKFKTPFTLGEVEEKLEYATTVD